MSLNAFFNSAENSQLSKDDESVTGCSDTVSVNNSAEIINDFEDGTENIFGEVCDSENVSYGLEIGNNTVPIASAQKNFSRKLLRPNTPHNNSVRIFRENVTDSCERKSLNLHKKTGVVKLLPLLKPVKKTLSDEELKIVINDLLKGGDPSEYSTQILNEVLNGLKRRKLELCKKKNYTEAKRCSVIAKKVERLANISLFSDKCVEKMRDLINKRSEAQANLDNINIEWDIRFSELDKDVRHRVQTLYDEYEKKFRELERQRDQKLHNLQVRNSPEMIDLTKKEEIFVKNDDFDSAQRVRNKIENLELKMKIEAEKKVIDDYNKEYQSLSEKQMNQLKIIEQWANERSIDYSRARVSDCEAATKRVANYTTQIESAKNNGMKVCVTDGFFVNKVKRTDAIKAVRSAALILPEIHNKVRVKTNLAPYRVMSLSKKRLDSCSSRYPLDVKSKLVECVYHINENIDLVRYNDGTFVKEVKSKSEPDEYGNSSITIQRIDIDMYSDEFNTYMDEIKDMILNEECEGVKYYGK